MTPTECREHMATVYAKEIKAEVDRAVATCPLVEGSDAAHALRALVGNDLANLARARIAEKAAARAA